MARQKCPECSGTGLLSLYTVCDTCNGTGKGVAHRKALEEDWSMYAIDAYKPAPEGYNECGRCGHVPRLWQFNNGMYAKCKCSKGPYESSQVRAESAVSYNMRHGGDWRDACRKWDRQLMVKWNHYARHGIELNNLPKGQR